MRIKYPKRAAMPVLTKLIFMNTKEKVIALLGIVTVCTLCFFAGTKYDMAVNGQLKYSIKLKVSYDLNVKDSITLFDGYRKVGTVPLTYGEPFAELILSDNE